MSEFFIFGAGQDSFRNPITKRVLTHFENFSGLYGIDKGVVQWCVSICLHIINYIFRGPM